MAKSAWNATREVSVSVKIPKGMTCSHCQFIRWYDFGNNPWKCVLFGIPVGEKKSPCRECRKVRGSSEPKG